MRSFEITEKLFNADITARILQLEQGLHISVFGGEMSHIGAVSIVAPDGDCSTVQFPAHKDGAVSEIWAKQCAKAGYRPVVVEAGIHYDNLDRQGINAVLDLSNEMLETVLHMLSGSE